MSQAEEPTPPLDEVEASRMPLIDHLIELRNLVSVAEMIIESALRRRESRGLHYTLDFPESSDRFLEDTVIRRVR